MTLVTATLVTQYAYYFPSDTGVSRDFFNFVLSQMSEFVFVEPEKKILIVLSHSFVSLVDSSKHCHSRGYQQSDFIIPALCWENYPGASSALGFTSAEAVKLPQARKLNVETGATT